MRKNVVFLFRSTLFFVIIGYTQQGYGQYLDSLTKVLETTKVDSTKIKTLNSLSIFFLNSGNYKSAMPYAEEALLLAKKTHNRKQEGLAYVNKGRSYSFEGKWNEAFSSYTNALKLFQEDKDYNYQAYTFMEMGNTYQRQGLFSEARKYFVKALDIRNKIGDKRELAQLYNVIASSYYQEQNYPESLKYNYKALGIFEVLKDRKNIAITLSSIGLKHQYRGDFQEALNNYQRSLTIWEELDNKSQAALCSYNIADVYIQQKQYNQALEKCLHALQTISNLNNVDRLRARIANLIGLAHGELGAIAGASKDEVTSAKNYAEAMQNYKEALAIAEKNSDKIGIATSYGFLGSLYVKMNKYDLARDYLEKSLAFFKGTKNYLMLVYNYEALARLDSTQGNYKDAYTHYKAYMDIRDSSFINDVEMRKLSEAKGRNEFINREDSLKFEQQLTNEKLKQQHLLAIQQQQELKIKGALLQLRDKQNQLDQVAYFQTESELKVEQSQRREKEKQLSILEKEKALQQANLRLKSSQLDLKEKELQAKQLERNVLIIGAILLLVLGLILWRNNQNKQKAYNLLEYQKKETDEQKERVEAALTELKNTQAQLVQREKMASLGELTAGIAHEIQNPLNFVNNFSEVSTELVEELKGERSKANGERDEDMEGEILNVISQNLQKIAHHGRRADAIVKGMLQHSRASVGHKEPTDINALADEYLRLSYHGLRAKDKDFNADFKMDFDKSLGRVNVIPQDIGRVLLNLYNNAFYAVNEKKKAPTLKGENYQPTVWVTTKRISTPLGAGGLELSVKDNGIGIPKKAVDKIFQPFFTTKPTGQGTGLGLSLSYDIIKAHGGELKVETKEGEGAEFIILLPII